MIVAAVFNTIFPSFSALVAAGNEESLKRLYHRSTQLMAVLILPSATVLALFSTDILQVWTRSDEVAHHAGPIASLLVIKIRPERFDESCPMPSNSHMAGLA